MKDTPNKTKRGRKPVDVSWPSNEFTASDVATQMEGRLSRVSVHSKINKAVSDGEVAVVPRLIINGAYLFHILGGLSEWKTVGLAGRNMP